MKKPFLFIFRARRVVFAIHMWIGLIVGLWFSSIGVTGAILAWRDNISNWEILQHNTLDQHTAGASMISIARAQKTMQTAYPNIKKDDLRTVDLPTRNLPFYTFTIGKTKPTQFTYLIDPYSGRLHKPFRLIDQRIYQLKQFHKNFLLGARGYLTNSTFTFFALPLILSGLWLWWPISIDSLKHHLKVRCDVNLRRILYDLHRVTGFYLYLFLALITMTGVVMAYQHIDNAGLRAYLKSGPVPEKKKKKGTEKQALQITPVGEPINADAAVAAAHKFRQSSQLLSIKIPNKPTKPYEITFEKPWGFVNSQTYYLNPYGGVIMGEKPAKSTFTSINKSLHLGTYGSILSKLIYTLAGLVPLILFTTGAWMWLHKKLQRQRAR